MEKVLADEIKIGGGTLPLSTVTNFKTFGDVVSVVTSNALVLAGVLAFVFVIVAGFGIITGSGDPKKIEQGKQRLLYALIGLLMVVFSFWIVRLISLVIGVDPLNSPF